MKNKSLLVLICIIGIFMAFPITVNAFNLSEEWIKGHGTAEMDQFVDVEETKDGNYVAIENNSYDDPSKSKIVKYDVSGNIIWEKSYDTVEEPTYYQIDEYENGDLLVVGIAYIFDEEDNYDTYLYILKTNAQGEIIWKKLLLEEADNIIYPGKVKITPDGGFIITGGNTDNSSAEYMFKYDVNADLEWQKQDEYDSFKFYYQDIIVDSDGNYVLVGYRIETIYDLVQFRILYEKKPCLVKYSSTGEVIWRKIYETERTVNFNSLCQDKNKNYIVVGTINDIIELTPSEPIQMSSNYSSLSKVKVSMLNTKVTAKVSNLADEIPTNDGLIIKYDKDGNKLNEKTYDTGQDDAFYGVASTKDNEYVVIGDMQTPYSFTPGELPPITPEPILPPIIMPAPNDEQSADDETPTTTESEQFATIVVFDDILDEVWSDSYTGNSDDCFTDVIVSSLGDVIISGYTWSDTLKTITNQGESDSIILKLSPVFNVEKDDTQNGSFEVSEPSSRYNNRVTITVNPNDGYVLDQIKVYDANNKEYTVKQENGNYYFDMPYTDVNVNVKYKSKSVIKNVITNILTSGNDKTKKLANADNPNTVDNISKYIALLIVGAIGIIVLKKTNKKNRA
ncbi:MAG: hypothetical protein E7160_01185 [Firmicutes bacterium]|nr:hypothetical protein [Bacillota bacterium]